MNKKQFRELDLSEEIQKAVQDMGYEEATAIQTAIIPLMLEGRDVIGHSQTGTGKTAAFAIPIIERIDMDIRNVQVLILCPTRELAIQSCEEIRKFSKYKTGIKSVAIYGGQPIDRQIQALKQGTQIVIGTPGRVMDHMRRHTLKFNNLTTVVLDEADEMLNMGFREDIETILQKTSEDRQTVLFSATMSKAIMAITKQYQKDPEVISVVHHQLTVSNIEQNYLEVPQGKKIEVLNRLLDMFNPKLSLIFCNTKRQVDELVSQLQLRGYMSDGLHGDMNQPTRSRVMDAFKNGKVEILVATDVAARGIDVDDVEVVFNYDIPQDEEYYVHRIGRTGRAGKIGKSFTFVCGRSQLNDLREIQRYTNAKINLMATPSLDETNEVKQNKFIEKMKKALDSGELEKYVKIVDRLIDEEYTSVDIATAAIKIIMEKDAKKIPSDDFDMNPIKEARRGYKDRDGFKRDSSKSSRDAGKSRDNSKWRDSSKSRDGVKAKTSWDSYMPKDSRDSYKPKDSRDSYKPKDSSYKPKDSRDSYKPKDNGKWRDSSKSKVVSRDKDIIK